MANSTTDVSVIASRTASGLMSRKQSSDSRKVGGCFFVMSAIIPQIEVTPIAAA
jgi:hypothetical protein